MKKKLLILPAVLAVCLAILVLLQMLLMPKYIRVAANCWLHSRATHSHAVCCVPCYAPKCLPYQLY